MWNDLRRDSNQFGLGLEFVETMKIAKCPNGSQIGIVGIDKLDETEKARGDAHPFALIDEAGTFRPAVLRVLVQDVVRPALVDFGGSMWQIGTPNPTCSGPFFDACVGQDSQYTVFSWDMLQNPHIKDPAGEMAAVRREFGWSELDAAYRREWLGEWCFSSESQVYAYDPDKNHCAPVTEEFDHYVVGIDLGYIDSTAVVVLGFNDRDERIWVVESHKQDKLVPSDVAALVRRYYDRFDPSAVVADTGGLGRALVEEMRQRYAIPIKAAQKRNKHAYIELMNGDFRTGRIQVEPTRNGDLLTEWRLLQWEELSRRHGANYRHWRISEACDDHLADASLYAWREAKHWVDISTGRKRDPLPGEPEFEDWYEDEMVLAFKRSAATESGQESDDWQEDQGPGWLT
jgi:hypothetical protein